MSVGMGLWRLTRTGLASAVRLLVIVWGAVTIVFFVGRVLPGDPAVLLSGPSAGPERIEAARATLGLDRPLSLQYWDYVGGLLQGDLGRSLLTGRDVAADLAVRLPASVELVTAALGLACIAAFTLAVLAASRPGGLWDRFGDAIAMLGTAVPTFFLGVLLILIFYVLLPVAPPPFGRIAVSVSAPAPVSGMLVVDSLLARRWDSLGSALHHLILPAGALALSIFPQLFRVFRTHLQASLRSDAWAAVRQAGLAPWLAWRRYVLPPVLAPALTLLAASYGYLIGGTVLVEHIYGWNGLGSYAVAAIAAGDYQVVQGVVLVSALAYALAYLAVDMVTPMVDPRLREVTPSGRRL